ncbi:hypothetical protein CLOM_g17729 [Closterium sp. NIES-68]|nr:hypothetical protein CLOM_g17729 [Closterium sp. NIES-68]
MKRNPSDDPVCADQVPLKSGSSPRSFSSSHHGFDRPDDSEPPARRGWLPRLVANFAAIVIYGIDGARTLLKGVPDSDDVSAKATSGPAEFDGADGSKGIRDKKINGWMLLRRFFRVAIAFFTGDCKWKARGLMVLLLVFSLGTTEMYVIISYTQRDFNTALSAKKQSDFYLAVWKFIVIILFAAPFFALFDYVQELLSLEWRLWLTNLLLSRYFANHAFLDLKMAGKLDNPDQRICEDVKHFVRTSLNIIITLIEKMMNLVAFAYVLWDISPPLVWFLVAYAVSGTFVVVSVFGKRLTWLQFQGFQREADLRYSLVRVKDNVESIAFYRGEVKEEASAKSFLHRVALNVRNRLVVQFHLSFFTNLYDFATIFVPAVIVAPRYFSGAVEFGVISQASYAFSTIYRALTVIVLNFNSFSELAAETERLESLLSSLSEFAADDSSKLFSHSSSSHPPPHPPHSPSHPSHSNSTTKDSSPSFSSTSTHAMHLGQSVSLRPSHTTSPASSSLAPTLSGQMLTSQHTPDAKGSASGVSSGGSPGANGEGAPLLEMTAMGGSTGAAAAAVPGGGESRQLSGDSAVIECTTATGRIQRVEGPCLTLTSVVIRTPNLRHTLYPSSLSFSLPRGPLSSSWAPRAAENPPSYEPSLASGNSAREPSSLRRPEKRFSCPRSRICPWERSGTSSFSLASHERKVERQGRGALGRREGGVQGRSLQTRSFCMRFRRCLFPIWRSGWEGLVWSATTRTCSRWASSSGWRSLVCFCSGRTWRFWTRPQVRWMGRTRHGCMG